MVSIIVPIYNVEKYINSCVDSILKSTYKDFELILVDDGSPDNCCAICDGYAQTDNRVKVIHKANGGLPDARNAGLRVAKGDFICFIDGDDLIHPKMIEVLHEAVSSGDYDFAMIDMYLFDENSLLDIPEDIDISHRRVLTQNDYVQGLYDKKIAIQAMQFDVVCNKLYRRELISGMEFASLKGAEDVEWNHRVCLRMNKAIKVDAALYYYLQRSSSLMHQQFSVNYLDRIKSYYVCLRQIPESMPEFKSNCVNQLYKTMIENRYNARHTKYAAEAIDICNSVYKDTRNDLVKSEISPFIKLKYLCFYHMPWLYNSFIRGSELVYRVFGR